MATLAIRCDPACRSFGERLSAALALPLVIGSGRSIERKSIKGKSIRGQKLVSGEQYTSDDSDIISACDYLLEIDSDGLALRSNGATPVAVRCDFVAGAMAHRRRFGGGRGQAIARAIGIKGERTLTVADLTAGLGRDGFVLATLGARVRMVERHPVVSALLADGLTRASLAARDDPALQAILDRLTHLPGDSGDWLRDLAEADRPDVIYLDPMFPERSKSARVKKEMVVLQDIVGVDDDAQSLLSAALTRARYRVVVKRPRLAPVLGEAKPGYCLEGKSTRYDIYPLRKIPD